MANTSAPALLQINGKNIHFVTDSGIVDKVSKRVETRLNASVSGGGTQQYGRTFVSSPTKLNVSSSNTTVTEVWMRSGNKEVDHTLSSDLSVREGQRVSVIMAAKEGASVNHYVGMINHNTGTWQSLNTVEYLVHKTVMPKVSSGLYFVMLLIPVILYLLFNSWVLTILAVGGLLYLYYNNSTKTRAARKAFGDHIVEVKERLSATDY